MAATPDSDTVRYDGARVQGALSRVEADKTSREEFAARVRAVPTSEQMRVWDQALQEVRLFTEMFYFVAWRLVEILRRRGALEFAGFRNLDVRGVTFVRNHLLEHPEKLSRIFQQHLTITDAGPVLKSAVIVVRSATGRTEPDGASIDRGLFVNAKELHDELMECLRAVSADD